MHIRRVGFQALCSLFHQRRFHCPKTTSTMKTGDRSGPSDVATDFSLDQPIKLPDDWRADCVRVPRCPTCRWNGIWDQHQAGTTIANLFFRALIEDDDENDLIWIYKRRKLSLELAPLRRSAASGHICCAVLLGLARHLNPEESGPVFFNNYGNLRLGLRDELESDIEDFPWRVFACCEGGSAPPGMHSNSST